MMGYPATIYRTGKCKPCGVTYRWEASEGLKLTDACCVDCGGDLKRAGGRGGRSHEVKDVEADWIRKIKKEVPE